MCEGNFLTAPLNDNELLDILRSGCPELIEIANLLLRSRSVTVSNTQLMTSNQFRNCTKQPCHADMLFLGQLSVLIYVTNKANPLMTYFLDSCLMGPDVVNSRFSCKTLNAIDYRRPPIGDKALRIALLQRFYPMFECDNATTFMDSFKQPSVMDGFDVILTDDSYRICCFRPDTLHFGPPVAPSDLGAVAEEERKTIFFALREPPQSSQTQEDYEIQFHALNVFRFIKHNESIQLLGSTAKIKEQQVIEKFKEYFPPEIIQILDKK